MNWSVVRLTWSRFSLLTSDRPLDWPGLGHSDSYIALPVGPNLLFIAEYGDAYQRNVNSTASQTKIVKNVNQALVQRARKFVWGSDESHYRFVCNWMSESPDTTIITEEQRKRVIDAVHTAACRGSSEQKIT
jgi:hypothetical protein